MMKCSINEIFGPTIQGEGLYAGVPSIFVRFNGCNLRCCFKGGSICDTAYTSHNPEIPSITDTDEAYNIITKILKEYPNITDIVFTGGEPMLQQEAVADIITRLNWNYDLYYTVETNGTIKLKDCLKHHVCLWSVSPKLSNSCCFNDSIPEKLQHIHRLNRINYPAVSSYINDSEVQLKFVYTDEETEQEIIDWVDQLYAGMDIKLKDIPVLIMPEGETTDQLNQSSQKAITACIKNGWRFCDRTHIRIWGNKRAV